MYAAFTKLKLASLVVFSAVICYLMAADSVNYMKVLWLILGGFAITGSSNGFNQIIERDLDKLMERTRVRPLPMGQMTVRESIVVASVLGVIGVLILFNGLNPLSGWLGLIALFMYVAMYTPLKRINPISVFVGAFPGAIPPMLGYVAETGRFDLFAGLLFAIQFMWQFPHFWAIAWKGHNDYARAGFKMLPSPQGKDKTSALITLVYALMLIPVSLLPYAFHLTGWISAIVIGAMSVWYAYESYKLYQSLEDKAAVKLMFASFIYLPVVQLALLFDVV